MEKDKCVICGCETEYTKDTHINNRFGYVEGCGQCCRGCYTAGIDTTIEFKHQYEEDCV